MSLIHIKNGRFIDLKNKKDGHFDLVIDQGKVKEVVSPGKNVAQAEVLDAKGCIVSPGFIDLHVHLREPGQEYKETIETGTRAAAAGGFTSVCCMANTQPVNDEASVTHYILKQAREKGCVNVYPIGALTKGLEGKELSQIGELKKSGCIALSDDGMYVQDGQVMRLAMEYAKSFDLPVISHAIDCCLAERGVMHEGKTSSRLGLKGIPNEAEEIAVARDILLAQLTGARLHVAHISTAGGVRLVRQAKKDGLPVTCEVTPHHLLLTDERVGEFDTNARMAPPLRREEDRLALIEALADGTIDAIATDHAPHAQVDKEIEFDKAAFGIVGLETALSLVYGALVKTGQVKLERFLEALTIRPAQIARLAKGSLEPGADADVVVFDPEASVTVDPARFYSKSRNTPFGGAQGTGKVRFTLVGGKVIFKDGEIIHHGS